MTLSQSLVEKNYEYEILVIPMERMVPKVHFSAADQSVFWMDCPISALIAIGR